jgi:8-oxo-dGTP diphosphatase
VNDTRQYPSRPVAGVGAVIVTEGKVVLVRRRFEPLAGRWSLPGGAVEVGETLTAAVAREMLEEVGLEVEVGPVIEVFDRIMLDEAKRVRYHYVLIDYLCWPVGGTLKAGSDVDSVALVDPRDFGPYELTDKAAAVIARGVQLAREAPRAVRDEA